MQRCARSVIQRLSWGRQSRVLKFGAVVTGVLYLTEEAVQGD